MLDLAPLRFRSSTADLTEDGSFADLRFSHDSDPASPDLRFQSESVGSGALGLGTPTEPQTAWLTSTHGGTKRRDSDFEAIEINLSPDGVEWTLGTPGYQGDEIAGTQTLDWHGRAIDRGCAPPGSDAIDFGLDMEFDTLSPSYPIITGGRAWQSVEPLIGHAAVRLTGSGYLSRFEGVEIDYSKAVGTAKYHGEIIKEILAAIGIPSSRIAISSTLGSLLEAQLGSEDTQCANGLALARQVADSAGYILAEDFQGNIVARHIAPVDEAPIADIQIEHLETAEIQATISAETRSVPLCWQVLGSRPEIPQDADGFVSIRRKDSETVEPYTTPAKYTQDASGNLTLARASYTENRVTSQIWVRETYFQGCLVQRIRETWGQFNPQVWRYKTASPASADGTPFTYNSGSYVFADGATKDDSSPMYQWWEFQLAPVSVQQEDYVRSSADGFSGALLQVTTSVAEWRSLERAWKVKTAAGNTFDQENVQADVRFFGGGRPVAGLGSASESGGFAQELWFKGPSAPTFAAGNYAEMGSTTQGGNDSLPGEPYDMLKISKWASQVVTDITPAYITVDEGRLAGHEAGRQIDTEGYGFPEDGDQYQYRNGDTRGTDSQEGADLKLETVTFTPEGEGSHTRGTLELDGKRRFVRSVVEEGQPGYLPNLDICTDELQALNSSVDVIGKHCLSSAAGDFGNWIQKESYSFGVETAEDATALAKAKHREASALIATLTLPISAIFYPKAPVRFIAAHKGIADPGTGVANGWVETVRLFIKRDGGGLGRLVELTIKLPVF